MSRIDEIRGRYNTTDWKDYPTLVSDIDYLLSCIERRGVEDEALLPVAVHVLRWLYATMNPNAPIDKSLLRITRFEIHAELEQAVLKAQVAALRRSSATTPTAGGERCAESLLRSLCNEHPHVRFVEGVLGGVQPLIEGHRIGVSHLLGRMAIGMSVAEYQETWEFSDEAIKDAFGYAQDVIDALIDQERECVFPAPPESEPQWTDEQKACLEDFRREMEDKVIPEIEKALQERAILAEQARHRGPLFNSASPVDVVDEMEAAIKDPLTPEGVKGCYRRAVDAIRDTSTPVPAEAAARWPTDEEAEAILREHGTSGKEVVNGFIEQILRERQQFHDDAEAHLRIANELSKARDVIDADRRAWYERYLALRRAIKTFICDRGVHEGQHVFDLTVCRLCDESYVRAEGELDSVLDTKPSTASNSAAVESEEQKDDQ